MHARALRTSQFNLGDPQQIFVQYSVFRFSLNMNKFKNIREFWFFNTELGFANSGIYVVKVERIIGFVTKLYIFLLIGVIGNSKFIILKNIFNLA